MMPIAIGAKRQKTLNLNLITLHKYQIVNLAICQNYMISNKNRCEMCTKKLTPNKHPTSRPYITTAGM